MLPVRPTRAGFSLLELMFAVAIGAFVVAAIYNLFTLQMKQFVRQDLQMEMHQNARMAVDVLTRTGRMAGFGTAGQTLGAFGASGSQNNPLPAVIAYNNVGPNGSDAITLVSMDPALVINTTSTSPVACNTTTLSFDPAVLHNASRVAQYRSGEMIMCYDYAGIGAFRSWLWPVTADGSGVTGQIAVADGTTYADFQADCPGTENLPLIMTCSRAEVATFYIDADDSDGIGPGSAEHPVLMMDLDFESPDADDVPVVDNIEDIQFAYCVETGTGTDCSLPTAWQDTLTDAEVDNLYMIRVSLVVRSDRQDPNRVFVGQRPALEDNPGATSTDNYYREVISTEVVVNNLRMQANL